MQVVGHRRSVTTVPMILLADGGQFRAALCKMPRKSNVVPRSAVGFASL
jgi:hypothetical protein